MSPKMITMAITPRITPMNMPALPPALRPPLPLCVGVGGVEVAEVIVGDELVGEGVETAAPSRVATGVPWP